MRIAVNTRLLLKNRLEGIGRFSLEILSRVAKSHPEHEFIFIFDRPYDEKFIFSKNIIPVVIGPQARHPFLFIIWFEISVLRVLKKYRADVFLSPDGFLSLRAKLPQIAVIHDINFEHYPKDLPPLVLWYYKTFFPRFVRKATQIVTVSEFSKTDLIQTYQTKADKVNIVYNGVKTNYSPIEDAMKQEVKRINTSDCDYFLYVGALHPRKNLVNLFKSFDIYKERWKTSTKLVVVGNKMWWTKSIQEGYEQMTYKDEVVFIPHQSTKELRKIYGAATALVYISYFEGFGIPIIESFACGTPVITSNVTSMPEVAGDAAIIVDPFNIDQIVESLREIEIDSKLRNELIDRGYARCKLFNWDNSAVQMWKVLEGILK